MPSIEIERSHNKKMAAAREAVERVAEHIAERFSVNYHWKGNALHFDRSGVHGQIELARGKVSVIVNLNFLLGALKGSIEREIHENIDREFS